MPASTHLPLRILVASALCAVFATSDTRADTLQSVTFTSATPGPGRSALGFNAFAYGSALSSGDFSLLNDPLIGVLGSSVLGSGPAGYVGGAGTSLGLTSGSGSLGLSTFPGSLFSVPTQMIGAPKSVLTFDVDFAVQRQSGTNDQSFNFSIFDARGPVLSNLIAYHSSIVIDPLNRIALMDKPNDYILTPFSIANNTAYHLSIAVDYTSATWSSTITNGGNSYALALNRAINVNGFTLSGYTTPFDGWANVEIPTSTASASNAGFADRLVFDNYTVSTSVSPFAAVPEPSTYGLCGALGIFVLIGIRKRKG